MNLRTMGHQTIGHRAMGRQKWKMLASRGRPGSLGGPEDGNSQIDAEKWACYRRRQYHKHLLWSITNEEW